MQGEDVWLAAIRTPLLVIALFTHLICLTLSLPLFNLAAVRELSLFYKLFLIDPVKRKATMLCPFVSTGIMHHEFQKYLRPDHLGIDYSYLEDFNTAAELPKVKEE